MAAGAPRVAVVSRGDPLTPYLHAALAERFQIVGNVEVELSGVRRAAVAAGTFRPNWALWSEKYMKSITGFRLRSRLARRGLKRIAGGFDVAVQTHALFTTDDRRTMIYVDCTYREAMRGWPAWTPQRGRALGSWLDIERRAYGQANHLFAFTDRTRDSLIGDYAVDPAKITVVGAGVNFKTAPEQLQRHRASPPTILFVGKDFVRKGGAVLLRAFEIVHAEFPDARLHIVGTDLPDLVPEGVEVSGVVDSRQQMDDLYAASTLFCLPSLFDPAPLVVLEAMAHGLPCVLSEAASHHVRHLDVEREVGLVVDTGDAAALARAMLTFLRDTELSERVGAAARRAMSSEYRWSDVVDRMAPAIEALAR